MKKLIIATGLLLGGFFAQAQIKGVKHVILIGMDGFGAYRFPKADNPNMKQMMQDGAWTLQARSVLPSSSAVNWASMVMGAGPGSTRLYRMDSRKPNCLPQSWISMVCFHLYTRFT